MDGNKLFVAIGSCRANRKTKQRAVIDTWAKDLNRREVSYAFVEGSDWHTAESAPREPLMFPKEHRLILPCGSDYYNLRDKMRWLFRWFSGNPENHRYTHIYKCDDDTFLHVDRLLELDLKGFDYVGRAINGGYAAGGAGYILSQLAALIASDLIRPKNIAAYMCKDSWGNHEDEEVGRIMRECGIELYDCRLFHHGNDGRPAPTNNSISGHHIQPEYMRRIWEEFNPSHPTPDPPPQDSLPESHPQTPGSDPPP